MWPWLVGGWLAATAATACDPERCARGDADACAQCTDADASVLALWRSGLAHQEQGDHGAAIADLTAAIAVAPGEAALYVNRGISRRRAGDLAGAIADYDQALSLAPALAAAFGNRGLAHQAAGRPARARADFDDALQLAPARARHWYNRAALRFSLDDLDGALADFDQAIARDPRDHEALYSRALVHRQRADLERARADLDEALRLVPSFALALYERAIVAVLRGRPKHALRDLDDCLARQPDLVAAHVKRGEVHQRLGDLSAAHVDYARAAELDPTASTLRRIAWRLSALPKGGRDGEAAVRYGERAVAAQKSTRTLEALAAAYAEAGRFDDAVRTQALAVKHWPEDDPGYADQAARLHTYERRRPFRDPSM